MRIKRGTPDFAIILSVMLLISIGIIMVFSSSAVTSEQTIGDPYYFLKKQVIWAALGTFAMYFTSHIDYFRLKSIAKPLFYICLVFLVLVLISGSGSKGATRWLGVGSLSFQPSETIKLAMVIFLSRLLSKRQSEIKSFSRTILPIILILVLVCGLIMGQPDLGTTVVVAGTTFLLLVAAGARLSHLALLALTGAGAVALLIAVAPYRMERFIAFLDPWADPIDKGFQTIQSLLALGSGGLFGVGLGASRQKLFYLPEKHTDFIYAIIGEELGFIGGALIILLFIIFTWRGLKTALDVPDNFGSLLAAGITIMITLQAIINIGVVTGSMPVTGITLPFISYGGSSLLITMTAVGILLNISRFSSNK
jgi:cell division protein FtsW